MHRKGLVIGILILMLGVNIGSTFAGDVDVKTMSSVVFDGNTLYVGGSGPNNYTRIQDAINDAFDGDTVFVYDDSSPYYEKVTIDKSISLIGENRDSTIINSNQYDVLHVTSDEVTIKSFKIKKGDNGSDFAGINISSNFVNIHDNIIMGSRGYGIIIFESNNVTLSNNIIEKQWYTGIRISDSININIINNVINSSGNSGLLASNVNNLIIRGNTFFNSFWTKWDISFSGNNCLIERNMFISNDGGVHLRYATNCIVRENNFINSGCKLIFMYSLPNGPIRSNNKIEGNFWYSSRSAPKFILGIFNPFAIGFIFWIFIPWFHIDWHPAQEPYDIGV